MIIAAAEHHKHGTIFHWVHHGGYPALFLILLSCGVGMPLPEDIPLIAAGILIQRGDFNLAIASICAWCGIIGGDCILYSLGRTFGADVTKIPLIGRHINVKRMARVEVWFNRYGVWVVAVGRLFAGIRGAMVVVAGATRFNLAKFILADGLAAIVSGGLFIFIGYKFGENQERIEQLSHEIKSSMLAGVAVLLIGIAIYVIWRKRQKRIVDAPEVPDEAAKSSAGVTDQ